MSYDIYDLKTILKEMRTYDPRADEYGGKHIIPGWAERVEVAVSRIESTIRASIVVELPEPYDDGHGNLWLPQDATSDILRAAGITVKGD